MGPTHPHTHKQCTRQALRLLVGAGLPATGPDPAQGGQKAGKGRVCVWDLHGIFGANKGWLKQPVLELQILKALRVE